MYHYELLHMYPHGIYALNFFISVIPAAILLNWLYYKNNRSIIIVMLMHFMLNLFSVIFQTEQLTKCIITVILLGISIIIIKRDKKFFFHNKPL